MALMYGGRKLPLKNSNVKCKNEIKNQTKIRLILKCK